jgi:tol-pal system protein YbgF
MTIVARHVVARGLAPRTACQIMAATATMIVLGTLPRVAQAQQAEPAAAPGNGVAIVNRIQNLEGQMQQMQGQIEVLQHELAQFKQANKDQYVDLDSRVSKLEHASAAPASATPAAATSVTAAASAQPQSNAADNKKPMSAADKAAAQAAYEAAFKSLRAGNYVDSARGFRAFIDKYPDSTLVANAYYWLGGSYYVTQNYKVALAAFQTLLQKYPDNAKAAEAHLRVADCEIGLKDYAAARATLVAVIKAHPGTTLEKRARSRLQDIPAAASKK